MLPLFARAGVGLIPGASKLPFVGGGRGKEIPPLKLQLTDQSIDRDKLAAYSRVCGFQLSDTLPATYPHILAFPLHLSLMTDSSFPFPAIGLVHISNRITQHRPIRAEETLPSSSSRMPAAAISPTFGLSGSALSTSRVTSISRRDPQPGPKLASMLP